MGELCISFFESEERKDTCRLKKNLVKIEGKKFKYKFLKMFI